MAKNHYLVLGVSTNATTNDIKAAYRHRALLSHPDQTGAEGGAFREVQEAYEILSDPVRRKAYDAQLQSVVHARRSHAGSRAEPLRGVRPRPRPMAPAASRVDLDSRVYIGPSERRRVQSGHRQTIEVTLSRTDAQRGGEVRLRLPRPARCPRCRGAGRYWFQFCVPCDGTGVLLEETWVVVEFPPGILSSWETTVGVPQDVGGVTQVRLRFHVR